MYLEHIGLVRQVAMQQTGFKIVHVVEREKNIGLTDNNLGIITEIVNMYGPIISFEYNIVCT